MINDLKRQLADERDHSSNLKAEIRELSANSERIRMDHTKALEIERKKFEFAKKEFENQLKLRDEKTKLAEEFLEEKVQQSRILLRTKMIFDSTRIGSNDS